MNLQGEFEGMNLTSIFQLLYNDQKTGVLTVESLEKESKVYFNRGTIVYATSSVKISKIGFLIKEDGLISTRQLRECLKVSQEKKTIYRKDSCREWLYFRFSFRKIYQKAG